jgi:hypothetical protein
LEQQIGYGSDLVFVVFVGAFGDDGEFSEVDEGLAGGVESELLAVEFETLFGEGGFLLGDFGVFLRHAGIETFEHFFFAGFEPATDFVEVLGV